MWFGGACRGTPVTESLLPACSHALIDLLSLPCVRRWVADGASIFSVADGKELAQTPYKQPTPYERIRANRIARSQLETPLVRGMRLLPVFSPGRSVKHILLETLPSSRSRTIPVPASKALRQP